MFRPFDFKTWLSKNQRADLLMLQAEIQENLQFGVTLLHKT
jgi:hypothetical protein